jgi:pilus assembly protein CpaB
MNRKRLLIIGTLAVFLAGVVTFGFYRVMRASLATVSRGSVPVVVAATDLPLGARLQANLLRLTQFPAADLPAGAFHSVAELDGRGVLVPMAKNELVLSNKVASEKAGAGLPAVIPSGMRAVSVKVNDVVSVAGFVAPGTRVDVLLTGNPSKDNDPGKVATTTVLENVLVLAAGPKIEPNSKGEPQNVPVITLLVTPEEAQKLALASTQGKIQLALRNPLDLEEKAPNTVLNASLYGPPKPAAPVRQKSARTAKQAAPPPPVTAYVVEMIRGTKKEEAKF